jgi:hypothetical protein
MDKTDFAFWLTLTGTLCWVVCFWWMYRISTKQNALLDQLHPQVGEIKEGMDTMVAAVKENAENNFPVSKDK